MITSVIFEKMPKAELHLHLRGALPKAAFLKLNKKYIDVDIFEYCEKERKLRFHKNEKIVQFMQQRSDICILFEYNGFSDFIDIYDFTVLFIREISDLETLISEVISGLSKQNIVYAEITVSLCEYLRQGLMLFEILECLNAMKANEKVRINWILDLVRSSGKEWSYHILEEINNYYRSCFIGITLGGNESVKALKEYKDVYSYARSMGLFLTVHSGEISGPKDVWEAINCLHIDRIGHGINSIYDQKLLKYLRAKEIPMEICITSNYKTGAVAINNIHPVIEFLKQGVVVTINTDDPTFFNTDLSNEYMKLYHSGVEFKTIIEIVKNGYKYSFLEENEKRLFLRNFEYFLTSIKGEV